MMTRSRIAGVLALALSGWGLACGGVRFSNDPPGFQYLPPEPVRSTMWVLAAEIEELERLLATPEGRASEVQRTAVRSTLARMREAARQLDQPGRSSQHPMLDHNLERFTTRLTRAIRNVDRDPPNYYLASTVGGACFMCHGDASETVRLTPRSFARR